MPKETINRLILFLSFIQLIKTQGFYDSDEVRYLSTYDALIKDSYSAQLSQNLISKCKFQMKITNPQQFAIQSSMTSALLQQYCGIMTICIIPAGFTVTMTSNLNVGALVVQGTIVWSDTTQVTNEQYLCAGYIAVRDMIILFRIKKLDKIFK